MRLLLILLVGICSFSSGIAQGGINPFEIQSRLDSIYLEKSQNTESPINIFDIEREEGENVASTNIFSTAQGITLGSDDTEEEESEIIPQVGEEETSMDDLMMEQKELPLTNPFDISHIPTRVSKLKKEADAFQIKQQKDIEKKKTGSNVFLFWLNLFTGLLLAIVINTQRGAISNILKGISNENMLKLNYREDKQGFKAQYILLYISFFINAAIFSYLLLYNIYEMNGILVFQYCLLGVLLLYLVRHLFLWIVGKSFMILKESSLYGFTILCFNIFIGIVLIPINLIIAFGPEKMSIILIYITVIFIGILFVLRSIRGLIIASKFISTNLFHFLLYLCTFEILPILILIKVIGNFEIA